MATETARPKTTEPRGREGTHDLFGDMWDATLGMQRQWLGFWTRPFGYAPSTDQMWNQWHTINTQCLNLNGRTSELAHQFVADQVKTARAFSDKAFEMTRGFDRREAMEITPEFTREWFDTAERTAKRAFTFGNDTFKAFEEFGLHLSETMMRAPAEVK